MKCHWQNPACIMRVQHRYVGPHRARGREGHIGDCGYSQVSFNRKP